MSSTPGSEVAAGDAGPAALVWVLRIDLLTEVGFICSWLNTAHADLIALAGRLHADHSWEISGIRSLEHWLTCFAGVSSSMARDLARIATRSIELPALGREVGNGRLSLGQAAVVAAHTPVGYDEDVVGLAIHATVPQLRRAIIKYDFTEAAAVTDEFPDELVIPEVPDLLSVAAQPAELSTRYERDRFFLEYSAPADIGALVERALIEAKDALFLANQGGLGSADQIERQEGPDMPEPQRVRLADAVEQLAIRSLQVGAVSTAGRAGKFRIYLHLETSGQGWVDKRGALPLHLLRKWTCDSIVQPVWETEGSPVNVGRAQRIVPRRTRRLVEDRDRGCVFPGCLAIHHLECHHVVHWADGGLTDMDELVSLCPHHHDRHHTGDFSITVNPSRPGKFTFETGGDTPSGRFYRSRPSLRRPPRHQTCPATSIRRTNQRDPAYGLGPLLPTADSTRPRTRRKRSRRPTRLACGRVLAVEILSPSTRAINLGAKKLRYESAGCPNYWIVDPDEP